MIFVIWKKWEPEEMQVMVRIRTETTMKNLLRPLTRKEKKQAKKEGKTACKGRKAQ